MMHGYSERKMIPQSASNKNCDRAPPQPAVIGGDGPSIPRSPPVDTLIKQVLGEGLYREVWGARPSGREATAQMQAECREGRGHPEPSACCVRAEGNAPT